MSSCKNSAFLHQIIFAFFIKITNVFSSQYFQKSLAVRLLPPGILPRPKNIQSTDIQSKVCIRMCGLHNNSRWFHNRKNSHPRVYKYSTVNTQM